MKIMGIFENPYDANFHIMKICGTCKKHAGGNRNLMINFAWPSSSVATPVPWLTKKFKNVHILVHYLWRYIFLFSTDMITRVSFKWPSIEGCLCFYINKSVLQHHTSYWPWMYHDDVCTMKFRLILGGFMVHNYIMNSCYYVNFGDWILFTGNWQSCCG